MVFTVNFPTLTFCICNALTYQLVSHLASFRNPIYNAIGITNNIFFSNCIFIGDAIDITNNIFFSNCIFIWIAINITKISPYIIIIISSILLLSYDELNFHCSIIIVATFYMNLAATETEYIWFIKQDVIMLQLEQDPGRGY